MFHLIVADGGSTLAPTHGPSQPERSHQSFDSTAVDGDALPAKLSPDLACAAVLEVLIPGEKQNQDLRGAQIRETEVSRGIKRLGLFMVPGEGDQKVIAVYYSIT